MSGTYGIAVVSGPGPEVASVQLGTWTTGPAWSTIKVPLAIAALEHPTATTHQAATAALTRSDNAAAAQLWATLGGSEVARRRVDATLAALGDTTTRTQAVVTRPEFSAYGQTAWSLTDQAAFTAALGCTTTPAVTQVLTLMGQVDPSQRWGAGRWPNAKLKGGWGPAPGGAYTARQLALLPHDGGWSAVAIAATARSGTFTGATSDLDTVTAWLRENATLLPVTTCPATTSRGTAAPAPPGRGR